ncbi:MAG: GNAT family N-acetyltransferase [Saprospiraceae bacterium]|nr:GNAT family N-acetyltransferase [Saprospiraceae bacterium]
MRIEVRKAILADAPIIALLGRITFGETFGHLFHDQQALQRYYHYTFGVKKIQSSLQKGNNIFWLAFADDLPVGYAKLKLHSLNKIVISEAASQLQKIYVLKDFLHQQIGLVLLESVIEEAQKAANTHLWLSVLYTNERAIQFYEKHGFVKTVQQVTSVAEQDFTFETMVKAF